MSNVEERYSRAIVSSHLEVTEFVGDVDSLVAAGWIRDGLATRLFRLRVEFDACDMRSIQPFPPDPVPVGHGEEVWDAKTKRTRMASEEERQASVRLWQIAEKKRVAKDFADRRTMAKALALVHMQSLPAARDALGRFVMAQATLQRMETTPEDELRLAGRILDHVLDPACEVCHGIMEKVVPGTPKLSGIPCSACDGTGKRRMRCVGRNGGNERALALRCMCEPCVLARGILADIDRKMSRVKDLMKRFQGASTKAKTIPLPAGFKMARPRLIDQQVVYEFSVDGRSWVRQEARASPASAELAD